MDKKLLELLNKIGQSHEDINLDKIERLKKEAFPDRTDVRPSELIPREREQWFQIMQPTERGMAQGRLATPSTKAFYDLFDAQHDKPLDIEKFNDIMEKIPENTSDPKRFQNIFNNLNKK